MAGLNKARCYNGSEGSNTRSFNIFFSPFMYGSTYQHVLVGANFNVVSDEWKTRDRANGRSPTDESAKETSADQALEDLDPKVAVENPSSPSIAK